MNVLVTGSGGYVGTHLIRALGAGGVTTCDIGLFGKKGDYHDFNDIPESALYTVDTIIHLAGLSNDPMAHFSPLINFTCNAAETVNFAYKAKRAGVKKFIFASSASVYQGISDPSKATVGNMDLKPDEPYAISKLMAERGLACLADWWFNVIVLRKGTIGGPSPRMRYDLMVNTMWKWAKSSGMVMVYTDANGKSVMRPHLDINDAVHAYKLALHRTTGSPMEIWNVYSQNLNVMDVATKICSMTGATLVRKTVTDTTLLRDYVMGYKEDGIQSTPLDYTLRNLESRAPTDYDNPQYVNIEVWKEWLLRKSQS